MIEDREQGISEISILKRTEEWLARNQWYIAGMLFAAAIILGILGFRQYYLDIGEPRSFLDYFYLTMQLFGTTSGGLPGPINLMLQIARFLAPAVAIYAAMKALMVIFYEQFQRLRVMFYKNHYVVCGLGRKGFNITRTLRGRDEKVVVIEINAENDFIKQAKEMGAVVFIGRATDKEMLKRAKVKRCKLVHAVCGKDIKNIIISNMLLNDETIPNDRCECKMHLEDLELYESLKEEKAVGRRAIYENMYEEGARAFFEEFNPFKDAEGKDASELHFVFVGFGRAGKRLVIHSFGWQDWKKQLKGLKGKPKVTILHEEHDEIIGDLLDKASGAFDHIEIFEKRIDAHSHKSLKSELPYDATNIYICFDDDTLNLSLALTVKECLDEVVPGNEVPIAVCLNDTVEFGSNRKNTEEKTGRKRQHNRYKPVIERQPVRIQELEKFIFYSPFREACKKGFPFSSTDGQESEGCRN